MGRRAFVLALGPHVGAALLVAQGEAQGLPPSEDYNLYAGKTTHVANYLGAPPESLIPPHTANAKASMSNANKKGGESHPAPMLLIAAFSFTISTCHRPCRPVLPVLQRGPSLPSQESRSQELPW